MQDETRRLERPAPRPAEAEATESAPARREEPPAGTPAGPIPAHPGGPARPPAGGPAATAPPAPGVPPAAPPPAAAGQSSGSAPPSTEAPSPARPVQPPSPAWERPLAHGLAQLEGAPGEPLYLPMTLSVGAGFKFGCGFMLAAGIATLLLFLVSSVLFFVASLMGLPLPVQ